MQNSAQKKQVSQTPSNKWALKLHLSPNGTVITIVSEKAGREQNPPPPEKKSSCFWHFGATWSIWASIVFRGDRQHLLTLAAGGK